MSDKKAKHVTALIGWTLLEGYYLAFHFSLMNLAVLVCGLLYLFFTTIFKDNGDKTDVIQTLPNILGTSLAVLIGYYGVTLKLTDTLLEAGAILENQINMMDSYWEEFGYIIVILAAVAFFLGKARQHPIFGIFFKYLWIAIIFAAVLSWLYPFAGITLMYLTVTLVFVLLDILCYKHCGNCSTAGKRWYTVLSVLFLAILIINPGLLMQFTQKGYMEYYFVTCGLKWYTMLYILVILVAVGYVMFVGCDEKNIKTYADSVFFLYTICFEAAIFFMTRFYVGYWWLVSAVYAIAIAVSATVKNPVSEPGELNVNNLRFMPTASLAVIITSVAGHYGVLLPVGSMVIAAGIFVSMYRHYKRDNWKKEAIFLTVIICSVGVCMAVLLWYANRQAESFAVLAGILTVFVAFVWTTSYDSGVIVKKRSELSMVTIALFIICSVFLIGQNGCRIKISVSDSVPTVEVRSIKDDQKVVSVEYYWLENDQYENSSGPYPSEVRLISDSVPRESGRLRVVATNNYGVVTEKFRWLHIKEYTGK